MAANNNKVTAENLQTINKALKAQADFYNNINDKKKAASLLDEAAVNRQKVINDLYLEQVKAEENSEKLSKNKAKLLDDLKKEQKNYNDTLKKENDLLEKSVKNRRFAVDLARQLSNQLKSGWKYIQDADKLIKSTNLNLGMSGAKAAAMRDAFEKSAGYVSRIGGTITDIQTIMQGYAEETGRARALTGEMVKDIASIGKGTGLGIEQATKLGAQFELMGFDAKSTMNYVQGVVDTTERMGVNTTKVLKNINDNFKKLNTYTFQQGVKGFAEMASYAEKFKIDIGQALNAAQVAHTLQGAIDLTAQLQVMGGEFAKTDPFQMLFLSRNDPAKFTEKIADMTKGVVTFRKVSDGTFEKFISPADRDRLTAVAKSLGIEASELTQIAERQAEIQRMRKEMSGLGLSEDQKKIIEGAAIFEKQTGKFQVQVGNTMKNISELTKDQADSFIKQQVSLEERAKQAMTFDETFRATIQTLKSSLLPILKQVNWLLDHTIKPIADLAAKGWGVGGAAAALISAGLLWKGVTNKLGNVIGRWVEGTGGRGISGLFGRARGVGGFGGERTAAGAGTPGSMFTKTGMIRKRAVGLTATKGLKNLGTGAGFGAAMIGAGEGLNLAAKGISQLSDSLSKLTPEQAKTLSSIVKSLSWFMVGAAAAAIGVAALGSTATAAAPGLLAFGAAVLMVGAGIGAAAAGIGFMGKGLAELVKEGKGAGPAMIDVGKGMAFIAASMLGFTAGALGFLTFSATMKSISKNADKMAIVGEAFKNIKTVLTGSKDDFIAVQKAVESISNVNTKGGGMLADLARLLKKPLQVEFANNGRVSLVNDITLNLDGKKFMERSYDVNIAVQKHESLRKGKGS